MNSFQLKVLALITMAIDHTGAVLFPQTEILRIIGRISFPIFCFLIAQGYKHTSNVKKYLLRLLAFAFLSEIPFDLAFGHKFLEFSDQNVFFTLFLGLLAIFMLDRFRSQPYIGLPAAAGLCAVAEVLNTDYGWYGVALILAFYILDKQRGLAWVLLGILTFVKCSVSAFLLGYGMGSFIQIFALLAIFPLSTYNGKKGEYSLKGLFYGFYPVHLLLLYFISVAAGV